MSKPALDQPVVIGKFTGVHGVAGWLKVMPYTEDVLSVLDYQPWYVEINGRTLPVTVKSFKKYKNTGLIVELDSFNDRDESKSFVNHTFYVDRSVFPPLAEGHYWVDLQGLKVITVQGQELGIVKELFESPAHDVMVVQSGPKQELIPYVVGPIIKEVDMDKGVIIVDWEG